MNDIEIRTHLDRILASSNFSSSGVYTRLLTYLTEETLKGENPKAFTIGHEVFNLDINNSDSSRVRVAVHKLRNRLEKYYSEEGISNQIVFTIPKGNYTLKFKQKKDISTVPKKKLLTPLSVFTLLLLITLIVLLTKKTDYQKIKKTVFWNELLTNDKQTVIVAGDFFMYYDNKYERERGRYVNIRDIKINSKEQLQEYVDDDAKIKQEDLNILDNSSYMPRDALYSMQYLFPLLYENKIEYQIILSSDFDWKLYSNYNIIYIGAFKNLKSLSILTDKLNIKYDYSNPNSTIRIQDYEEARVYKSSFSFNKNIDYTLVSKLPGSKNNVIHLFVSDNDIGCIETVRQFTQLDSLKQFDNNVLVEDNFFKAIYKAEGIIRTGTTCKMVDFVAINDSTLTNFWHFDD